MTRKAGVVLAWILLAGCSVGSPATDPTSPPSGTSPSGCTRLTAPAVPANGSPTAVLRDLAAGPREFLIGSPGGPLSKINEATGASAPRLGGDRVFFSVGQESTSQEIRAARRGECSAHVATGAMTAVDSQGRALVISNAGHARIVDASGRPIADVIGPNGSWTADGHLAVPTASSGLKVYDIAGTAADVNLPAGSTPIGTLGASQEMVSTPAGVQAIDLLSGRLQSLSLPANIQRVLSGSPDGNYVAVIDRYGNPEVVSIRDGHSMSLPNPGPSLSALWDRGSQWVAVQSLYGGAAMRVADGKIVELGPLNVVSW